jgi:hypothetical protein
MANYFNFLKNMTNPFEGVIDTITDPVNEGGINIFGAGVDKNFEAMKTAGLLTNEEYKTALNNADKQSKRNAIVQGFLGYGLQNFDKGYGSALDPRYLKAGLASAIPAAQKPFNELAPNVMNIEKLKTFKRDSDKDAKVRDILKKGFYKKTIGKDGRASFDMNYDIVNEVLKATDVPTAAAIQNIFSSKATLLNSLKTKYDIKYEGDNVFYTPKDGSGVTKIMTETGLVDAPYKKEPEDFVPDKGELQAFNMQMVGIMKERDMPIKADNLKDVSSSVYDKALFNYNKRPANSDKTLVDFGYDEILKRYEYDDGILKDTFEPKISESNQKPKVKDTKFIIGNTYTSRNSKGEEFSAKFIGYNPTTGEPLFEDIN